MYDVQGGFMEKIVRQTLLFDFYGELLTQHQQEIFEDVVCNDISCSEAAQREGVSRQSINELVRKCGRILEGYEEKLHLVEKFLKIREEAERIKTLSIEAEKEGSAAAKQITLAAEDILKRL